MGDNFPGIGDIVRVLTVSLGKKGFSVIKPKNSERVRYEKKDNPLFQTGIEEENSENPEVYKICLRLEYPMSISATSKEKRPMSVELEKRKDDYLRKHNLADCVVPLSASENRREKCFLDVDELNKISEHAEFSRGSDVFHNKIITSNYHVNYQIRFRKSGFNKCKNPDEWMGKMLSGVIDYAHDFVMANSKLLRIPDSLNGYFPCYSG